MTILANKRHIKILFLKFLYIGGSYAVRDQNDYYPLNIYYLSFYDFGKFVFKLIDSLSFL